MLTEEIAVRLGATQAAVRLRCHILGLRRDADVVLDLKWVPPHIAQILREQGVEAFRAAVWNFRRELDDLRRTRVEREEQARREKVWACCGAHNASGMERNVAMVFKRACGAKLEEIAQEYGITRERVRQICENTVRGRGDE